MEDQDYERRLERLLDIQLTFERDYLKALLTVASGTLALSLTLLHVVMPEEMRVVGWLYASWTGLSVCVLAVMCYLSLISLAVRNHIRMLEEQFQNQKLPSSEVEERKFDDALVYAISGTVKKWWLRAAVNPPLAASLALYWTGLVAFVTGFGALILFVSMNLS